MKKLLSVILILSMLLFCACSGKNDVQTEASTATTTETTRVIETTAASTTKKAVEYFENWESELVPKNFPSPPEKAHSLKISSGKASTEGSGYRSDWIRISFICTENSFFNFAKQFEDNGYTGGFKNFQKASYYENGFMGYWQDGKNIVKINDTKTAENNEIRFTFDVIKCQDNFPDALLEFFPKFNGFTISEGTYCGHDDENSFETQNFKGTFNLPVWHWEFRFEHGFIGVEQTEFENYYNKLGKENFSGSISNSTLDGTTAITVDLTKEIDGNSFGVFMLYNQTLKTLDIAYTNDSSLFLDA